MTPVGSLVRMKYALRIGSCALAVLLCGSSLADRPTSASFNQGRGFAGLFSASLPDMTHDEDTQPARDGAAVPDYALDAVRDDGAAVPRLFLARVPADLRTLDSPEARKDRFVKVLLPLILAENERIAAERKHLLRLQEYLNAGGPISETDRIWLQAMADRYEVEYDADELADTMELLVERVDVVPPSLAIGQAALETGWGTSAAARGQAMFGQMIFSDDGERAEVRRFERLAHAVRAYELNLNTHKAYARFRAQRAAMREHDKPLNGFQLALTLVRYSERKMDYVKDVRGLIKANKLQPLDAARLDGGPQLAGF
jgi:Bax protein